MKRLPVIICLLLFCLGKAQNADTLQADINVDALPEYPGGDSALASFIAKNYKFPTSAIQDGHVGRGIIVSFLVTDSGAVSDLKALKAPNDVPAISEELTRVLEKMPDWTPAKRKGRNVEIYYAIVVWLTVDTDTRKLRVGIDNKSRNKFYQKKADDAYNLGVEKMGKDDVMGAIECFTHALKINPKDIDALYNRAAMKFKINDLKGACEDWHLIQSYGKPDADDLIRRNCGKK